MGNSYSVKTAFDLWCEDSTHWVVVARAEEETWPIFCTVCERAMPLSDETKFKTCAAPWSHRLTALAVSTSPSCELH